MRYKGINYDVGVEFNENFNSQPSFDKHIIERELRIIRDDLHCTDIRLSGTSIERLTIAAGIALKLNLGVWLSPQLHNKTAEQTLSYIIECSRAAETLRVAHPDKVKFIVGCELTWFMYGIMKGSTYERRLGNWLNLFKLIVTHNYSKKLNAFLDKVVPSVRHEFNGKITYAASPLEKVDWTPFDYIGLDYYRDKSNRQKYGKELKQFTSYNKPIIITEVGLCTYQGAQDKGALGHSVAYKDSDGKRKLKPGLIRDESLQAQELIDMLSILNANEVEGTFVFLFSWPTFPYDEKLDLDIASYSIVKSLKNTNGTTYSDMKWEPKKAFFALSKIYKKF